MSRGIEKHGVPFEIGKLVRDPALLRPYRSKILEAEFKRGRTLWDIDMERPHVDTIAHPRNALAVGDDNQPGHVRDRVGWRVCPGEPLRIKQCNIARLHRNGFMHGEDAVRDVSEVHAK